MFAKPRHVFVSQFLTMAGILATTGWLGSSGLGSSPVHSQANVKEIDIAGVVTSGPDHAWDGTFMQAYKEIQKNPPPGVKLGDYKYTEAVFGDDALAVLREYAESGKYEIIWANSSYSDQVEKLMVDYPDILWVVTGSGNKELGKNQYLLYMRVIEPAYLMGVMAGMMTKSNTLGVVATYAFDDVNDHVNAFMEGAKSVNANAKVKVTFIESWYDPAKASEAAYAQIAAGVDQLYMVAEAFEPCKAKNIQCYGIYKDYNAAAPDHIVSSAMAGWKPGILWILNEYQKKQTSGQPFNAPMGKKWFTMAEGGSLLAPYHGLDSKIPPAVKAKVNQVKADIMSGKLKVNLNIDPPKAN